jgi:hypothetical protein
VKEKQAERQAEPKNGLTFEELEAQGVGGLLPDRIEMRRKRKRGRNKCRTLDLFGLCLLR